jgi:general secretion pathway protein J
MTIHCCRTAQVIRGRQSGFTLVELLVAITLFSVLTLVLFGSLQFGLRVWHQGTDQLDRNDETIHLQAFLRRTIEQIYPHFLSNDPTHMRVEFEGTSTSVRFLVPINAGFGAGGRLRLTLFTDANDRHRVFVVESRAELAANNSGAPTTKTKLLAGLEAAQLSYFGRARSDKVAEWHTQWAGETALPDLMRVRVLFAEGDARRWPDLAVAPRIGADVGCVYDQMTGTCRGR